MIHAVALKLFFLATLIASVTTSKAQNHQALTGYTIATWNIAKLVTEDRLMFGDGLKRTKADYENLRRVREAVNADIYALQEISSPAALKLIFDPKDYVLCFSGQWWADGKGLAPNYSRSKVSKAQIEPRCFNDGEIMEDTAGGDDKLKQYVALAVRRSSGITVVKSPKDVPNISVMALDKGKEASDAEIRNLRWGLDVKLERDGKIVRVLVVHLKSGCPDRPIPSAPIAMPTAAGSGPEGACSVVSRQIPELKNWLDGAVRTNVPFMVVGDFNRRFTLELQQPHSPLAFQDQYWKHLVGDRSPGLGDDIQLKIRPDQQTDLCYVWDEPDYRHPIDYFLGDEKALPNGSQTTKIRYQDVTDKDGRFLAPSDAKAPSTPKWPGSSATPNEIRDFRKAIAPWTDRLSDHCPRKLTVP